MGADKSAENTLNAQNFPAKIEISMKKKLHWASVVRVSYILQLL
jgi:hypothetical protein